MRGGGWYSRFRLSNYSRFVYWLNFWLKCKSTVEKIYWWFAFRCYIVHVYHLPGKIGIENALKHCKWWKEPGFFGFSNHSRFVCWLNFLTQCKSTVENIYWWFAFRCCIVHVYDLQGKIGIENALKHCKWWKRTGSSIHCKCCYIVKIMPIWRKTLNNQQWYNCVQNNKVVWFDRDLKWIFV